MRILHVVDLISQTQGGGSAVVPYMLAQAQAKLGHEVTIFASDDRIKHQIVTPGITVRLFKCWLNLLGGFRITPSMWFADFKQFNIIHLHNYRTFVNIIASTKGVPFVLQAHGSASEIPKRYITKPLHDMLWGNLLLKRARYCIADAQLEIDQYIKQGARKSRITLVDLGIDGSMYENLPRKRQNDYKTVLYLGKMHSIKGPDLLARAFKQLNRDDVRLAVSYWDDGYAGEFKKLVRELGIGDKIDYLGFLSQEAKVQAYVDADVYVLPSRYEMFGLCILESCACGTPVIMTDRCAIAGMIPRTCARLVPFDEFALASAINYVLDSDYGDKYRKARITWARQYDWNDIANRLIALYQGALCDH